MLSKKETIITKKTLTCINTSRFYVRKIVIARIHMIREFTIRRDKIETAGFSNINVRLEDRLEDIPGF